MNWPTERLEALCSRVTSGGTPSRANPAFYVRAGIPWVKTQELTDSRVWDTSEHISEEAVRASSAKLLPESTVLIAMYGATAGKLGLLATEMACNQACCALVADPCKSDPRYLFYAILNARGDLRSLANGAAQQNLSGRLIKQFRIPAPPIGVQRALAGVLGALDDKIAVNECLVDTAENVGGAVFERCFSEAIRHLAGQAELPDGWRARDLGSVTETIETGSRPKGGVAGYTSGVPSIGAESVVRLATFDFSKVKYVPESFFASLRRGVLQDRDILVYKDGGKPGDFKPHVSMFGNGFPFDRMCINEHVYRVRLKPDLGQEFGYYWLSSPAIMAEMRRRGTGAAIPGINSTAVKSIPVVEPPADRLLVFRQATAPLVERSLQAASESRTLATLRDMLLPQLMSGKLRVRDAEKIVEDAV